MDWSEENGQDMHLNITFKLGPPLTWYSGTLKNIFDYYFIPTIVYFAFSVSIVPSPCQAPGVDIVSANGHSLPVKEASHEAVSG